MESRIRSIFLTVALVAVSVSPLPAWSQETPDEPPQVIEPDVARRDLDVGAIDTEDFELTGFVGLMSVEDFETNAVYGARLAYHINESLFTEATIGQTKVGDSSAEKIIPVELFDDRTLTYYDISLGWNVLPGESFFGKRRAYNSMLYLIGGLGSTDFADDDNFTVNFGFGFKVLPTDSIAVRIEARDYMFDSDITADDKAMHNMQGTISISWFF